MQRSRTTDRPLGVQFRLRPQVEKFRGYLSFLCEIVIVGSRRRTVHIGLITGLAAPHLVHNVYGIALSQEELSPAPVPV